MCRDHESMIRYAREGTRRLVVEEMKRHIRANPAFYGKLELPSLQTMARRLLATATSSENGNSPAFFHVLRNYLYRNGAN